MAQELSPTTVYLLSAQGYSAYAPGSEGEAVLGGFTSPESLRVLAAAAGSKVTILAFSLELGPHYFSSTGLVVVFLTSAMESIHESSELRGLLSLPIP